MHVTYKPEDGPEQRWEFVPGRVRSAEAELVEKRYGKAWEHFCGEVQAGSMKARRVLLWHLLRRDHHTLRFEDTPDFYTSELVIEHDLDELYAVRDRLAKADLPESEREQMLALLGSDIADAKTRGEALAGKATSKAVD